MERLRYASTKLYHWPVYFVGFLLLRKPIEGLRHVDSKYTGCVQTADKTAVVPHLPVLYRGLHVYDDSGFQVRQQ